MLGLAPGFSLARRPGLGRLLRRQRDQGAARHPLEHLAVFEEDFQVGEREPRVLTGEALGAAALPSLDRLDQPAVVAVGDDQDLSRGRELRLGQDERARPRKRERDDAVERPFEHRAAGELEQPCVEGLVKAHVAFERVVVRPVDERMDRLVDLLQRPQLACGGAALGREPSGGALEHPAQLDCVADVALRELAHDVAAAGQPAQQTLVLELGEREPQRRTRDAQTLYEPELGHPLAGRERPAEDQLTQLQERACDLGAIRWPGQLITALDWRRAGSDCGSPVERRAVYCRGILHAKDLQ